jgi:hypothetical protein
MDWAEALLVLGRPEDASRMVLAAENVRLALSMCSTLPTVDSTPTRYVVREKISQPGKWYPDAVVATVCHNRRRVED